jgi:ribonuclease VapC
MIVDASAVLAILFAESDADRFAAAIAGNAERIMSAVNWFEAGIAIDRRGRTGAAAEFEALMERGAIDVVPYDHEQAQLAREAFAVWGKGRHPAALNMGDCAAYALARSRRQPLLFKGGDFALTDIQSALKD